jgi:hypothetical protein
MERENATAACDYGLGCNCASEPVCCCCCSNGGELEPAPAEESALGTSNASVSVSVGGYCAMKGAASTMLLAAEEGGCWMVSVNDGVVGRTDATVKASANRPTAIESATENASASGAAAGTATVSAIANENASAKGRASGVSGRANATESASGAPTVTAIDCDFGFVIGIPSARMTSAASARPWRLAGDGSAPKPRRATSRE